MKMLFTAAAIAQMRLQGLPTTKSSILARAAREGWYYEEQYGIGGVRKVFEVPAHYVSQEMKHREGTVTVARETAKPYMTAGDAGENALLPDESKLAQAARIMEEYLSTYASAMPPGQKANAIAILYKLLAAGADSQDLIRLLHVVTGKPD